MKKRMLSLLCTLALCLGLLPVTALAVENAPDKLYVGNYQITNYSETTYLKAGSTEGSLTAGDANDWTVKYEPSSATLTLNNATIKTTHSYANSAVIYAESSQDSAVSLTIVLQGNNTIGGSSASYGIYVNAEANNSSYGTDASLTIRSDGNNSLDVSGSTYGINVKSGSGNASLTIENASVDAKTTSTYSGYAGVNVQSSAKATSSLKLSLTVKGGSLTANGGTSRDGILFYVGSPNATDATTSLTVSGNAIVDAKTGGISASDPNGDISNQIKVSSDGTNGGIVFDGTEGTVYGEVTLQDELTIGSGETLTIPEGSKLDCNGNLTNSGTILVESGGTLSGGTALTTPTITTDPTGQTVTEGSAAEFSVTATADNGELTYQWQQSTDNGQNWADISGANAASYTTAATTTDMSGNQYRCVVKSAGGVSVISQAATLTVQAKPASVPVTGVSLDKATLELYTGDTATLTATVQPDNATNQNVTWQSDNANVATVEGGTVTAVGAGETDITVTTEDGGKTATCKVTVTRRSSGGTPAKTPSEETLDKIESAKDGDTVTVNLYTGNTKLDKEVFEALAGRDVTLEISLSNGVTWTVNGQDIPADAELTDLDMGVTMDTSTIPVDVINLVTGEKGAVQMTLAHDGEFGFTMTLTAPLGTEHKGLWANLYHYDTTLKQMLFETAAKVDANGDVSLPFTHASEYAIVLDEKSHDLPFTDVTTGAWYENAVAYVYRQGIMAGTGETTFEPNATLSRAMVAQILYNLEGQPDISQENLGYPYSDVDAEAWYGDAVYWARLNGVSTGYEDNTFRPDKAVSREELAQMLYNYAKYKEIILPAVGDLSRFPDGDKVSPWAQTAMKWATGLGVINGYEDNTLRPGGNTTRAEAASMILGLATKLVSIPA
jgi:hypothetical protein